MTAKRFLDNGSPLITTTVINKTNINVRFLNPQKVHGDSISVGTYGRIHSQQASIFTVWLLDDKTMNTVMIQVPLHMMGIFFNQHPHNIFPHLG